MYFVTYKDPLTTETFMDLFRGFPDRSGYIYLVIYPTGRKSVDLANEIISLLGEDVVSVSQVLEWPGTILTSSDINKGGIAIKCCLTRASCIPLCREIIDRFVDKDNSPGDISILDQDGRAWFVCIVHEGDSFFYVEEKELEQLQSLFHERLTEPELLDESIWAVPYWLKSF